MMGRESGGGHLLSKIPFQNTGNILENSLCEILLVGAS